VGESGDNFVNLDYPLNTIPNASLTRFLSRWKGRLAEVDEVEDAGENLAQVFDSRRVTKFWNAWRRTGVLRATESLLTERVNLRVMSDTMAVWKKRM
jgi:protein SFI1